MIFKNMTNSLCRKGETNYKSSLADWEQCHETIKSGIFKLGIYNAAKWELFNVLWPEMKPVPTFAYGDWARMDENENVIAYTSYYVKNSGQWNCSAGVGVYFCQHSPFNKSMAAKIVPFMDLSWMEAVIAALETMSALNVKHIIIVNETKNFLNHVHWWMTNWRGCGGSLDKLLDDEELVIQWNDGNDHIFGSKGMKFANELAMTGAESEEYD